jgi:uncharacterized protein YndB with AHSA1/START domain
MPSSVLVALRVAATPERTFEAFTREIGAWWRPNGLFQFVHGRDGVLSFEPWLGGRLAETFEDGSVFEVGRITAWEPPSRLEFSWRQASFEPHQGTRVRVHFEPIGDETRVTVEHLGWDTVPAEHAARHRFRDAVFLQRHGEWWRELLRSLREHVAASHKAPDEMDVGDLPVDFDPGDGDIDYHGFYGEQA